MVIFMYIAPMWGRDEALGPNFFFSKSLKFSPTAHFLQVFPLNDNLTILPIKMHTLPMLTLP